LIKSVFPEPTHDHDQCVEEAVADAVRICRERGSRFTERRRQVLELIWTSHEPVGAYEILDMMNAKKSARIAPMTVYRAIDFLMANGLVHRIASRNVYVGCSHPDSRHAGYFLICRECGRVAEYDEDVISSVLRDGAQHAGFDAISPMIEIEGRCLDCRENSHD
jgi:Fur family zinc uptake transcriptional regulator